jgi:hypothetical protein
VLFWGQQQNPKAGNTLTFCHDGLFVFCCDRAYANLGCSLFPLMCCELVRLSVMSCYMVNSRTTLGGVMTTLLSPETDNCSYSRSAFNCVIRVVF